MFFEREDGASTRIVHCYKFAQLAFQEQAAATVEVPFKDLLESFASAPIRHRHRLRQIARRIWPILDSRKCDVAALDAAVLGLHVQVERLFNIQEVQP
jgi:hypothetical protein